MPKQCRSSLPVEHGLRVLIPTKEVLDYMHQVPGLKVAIERARPEYGHEHFMEAKFTQLEFNPNFNKDLDRWHHLNADHGEEEVEEGAHTHPQVVKDDKAQQKRKSKGKPSATPFMVLDDGESGDPKLQTFQNQEAMDG